MDGKNNFQKNMIFSKKIKKDNKKFMPTSDEINQKINKLKRHLKSGKQYIKKLLKISFRTLFELIKFKKNISQKQKSMKQMRG